MTDMQGRTAAASLATAGTVLLSTVLLTAGCASSGAPAQAPAPHSAAPHSTGPHSTAATAATTAELRAMAAKYLAIAQPANRELDHELDGFKDHAKDDLAAARADLRAVAATDASSIAS